MDYHVDLSDGRRTAVESWGSSGPALLCVHGITSSRKAWVRFGERFGAHYRVFAYDQRGHGDSGAITAPMSLAQSVADLRAVAHTIAGPLRAIVGHSWGGAVVLLGGRSTACERVVAIDPVIVAPDDWEGSYVAHNRHDFALPQAELEPLLRRRYADLGWHPSDIDGKIHAVRSMRAEALENLGRENNVPDGWNLRETVRDYPKPLLVLLAKADESTVSVEDRIFLQQHGGPNLTTVLFPEHGHNLHRLAFDRFAQTIEPFLA